MADLGDLGRGAASWSPPPRPQPESALARQVNENAKKDLKEGLLLYNSENNVGLKNAWNIIQAEVRAGGRGRCGWKAGPGPRTPPPSPGWVTGSLGQTWRSGRQLQRGGWVGSGLCGGLDVASSHPRGWELGIKTDSQGGCSSIPSFLKPQHE